MAKALLKLKEFRPMELEGQCQMLDIRHAGNHLKLHNDQMQISKSEGAMQLKVQINKGPAKKDPSRIILWFPDTHPVFVGPREISISVFPTADPKVWEGETVLTVNSAHPDGVVPYVIFCDIDGGQAGDIDPAFGQRGSQMVDGKNSHPDCNVGP